MDTKKLFGVVIVVFLGFWMFTDPNGLATTAKDAGSHGWHLATEAFTGVPGRSVPLAETIKGCQAILRGDCDQWAESSFYMIGTIDEAAIKEPQTTPSGKAP